MLSVIWNLQVLCVKLETHIFDLIYMKDQQFGTSQMMAFIRKCYSKLPVIRELKSISANLQSFEELSRRLRAIEGASMVQAIEAIKSGNDRYTNPKRLLAYGSQYWSQNLEDGMISEILQRISVCSESFVEIGVENGSETNTTSLLSQGWHGWWIEGNPLSCHQIRSQLKLMPSTARRLQICESLVTPDNVQEIFKELGIPDEVDVFSLDIDLDTYHVWNALQGFRPRVVVVEYNACIEPSQAWVHPYTPNRIWDGSQSFGASLKAFELLARKLGYSLVGCDITGVNAFFVRDDLVGDYFMEPYTSENHYEPPRYSLTYRWSHPSRFFVENHLEPFR